MSKFDGYCAGEGQTSYWSIYFEKIRFLLEDFRALFDDEEALLLSQAAFTIEVIFEEGNVRL